MTGDGATFEHVDLAVNNGGPFDPAAYGGDEATALAVRQAFLKTIPRQEIVDRLIVPLNPNATIRNSYTQVPGSPGYDVIAADQRDVGVRRGRHRRRPGLARGGRRHDARPGALPLRRQQPAACVGVRADPRLRGAGRLRGPRRRQPHLEPRALRTRTSTTPPCSAGSRRPRGLLNSEANYVTDGANNFYGYSNEEVDAAVGGDPGDDR